MHTALINLKFRKRAYSRLDDAGKSGKAKGRAADVSQFHQLLFPGKAGD